MTFKKLAKPGQVPSSPEKLFLDLPRRKIPGVLAHQAEVMRSYSMSAADAPDVALQLPTGSGKTLVGTLIAEWIRRKRNERVVYLAPTKQLVHQIVDQCENKYGIQANSFTGTSARYSPIAKTEYKTAEKIAVTTYSSLFNSNPFFSDANTIIIDDAHASENYVSTLWSVSVDKNEGTHSDVFGALSGVLKRHVDGSTAYKLSLAREENNGWVEKLSSPAFAEASTEIRSVLDGYANDIKDIRYGWSLIRDRLHSCHLYFNESEILIRPLISPTWTHSAFTGARQRIYMSATLGGGGDLERLFGRARITRIPVPRDWDKQGVGRRLFLFPGMSLEESESDVLRLKLMKAAGRSLVLVPNTGLGDKIKESVESTLHFKVVNARDIEESQAPFTSKQNAVAVIANRYDGIDFPGDACRLMFVEGLPKATNLQERFLMNRMGAYILFNERVQTRVLQAIGRCTRSLEDYSAVVVLGEDLQDYLTDKQRRAQFHPEIQAEIQFGIEQSRGVRPAEFESFLEVFLENGVAWEAANQDIIDLRESLSKADFPAMAELESAVAHEIEYQKSMWQGDFIAAMDSAASVLAVVSGESLRGYRALWNYLAGSAAMEAFKSGMLANAAKSEQYFFAAKNAAVGLPWLVALARRSSAPSMPETISPLLMVQVESIERQFERLGTSHDRKYSLREREILEGLSSESSFETAHVLLGQLLGFDAAKVERDGSPDPWWSLGEYCIVFEDHAGALPGSALSVEKSRQAADHPRWIRENVAGMKDAEIVPVLISPVGRASEGARPHLKELYYWPLAEFRLWATGALETLRGVRSTFQANDLAWRAEAAQKLKNSGLDMASLLRNLKSSPAEAHIDC